MIPAGATGGINLSWAWPKERVGLNRGAARTLRLWGFETTGTARSAASRRRSMGMSAEVKVDVGMKSAAGRKLSDRAVLHLE
jgi:hypothetical protein